MDGTRHSLEVNQVLSRYPLPIACAYNTMLEEQDPRLQCQSLILTFSFLEISSEVVDWRK
jgi:hypothetical protein